MKPDKQTADMSGDQLEAWWGLSPEDLAIVQADPSCNPAPSHPTTGTLATSVSQQLRLWPQWTTPAVIAPGNTASCLNHCAEAGNASTPQVLLVQARCTAPLSS